MEHIYLKMVRLFENEYCPLTNATIFFQVYIPSCRKESSVCSLPDGDARYAAMLKFHCDVDLTPEQTHQIGHEQVRLVMNKIEHVSLGRTPCSLF